MSSSAGQKVNDPTAPPVNESTGIVTSDSLAAESLQGGGLFATGNLKSGVSGQSSAGLTANTTDTSAAATLDPAPDSESRDAQREWSEQSQLNAGSGLTAATGTTAPTAYSAGQLHQRDQKPKGANITEGGFAEHATNASFNGEIGTRNDPGRLAEQTFQRNTQRSGLDAAQPKQDQGDAGRQPYSALGETSA